MTLISCFSKCSSLIFSRCLSMQKNKSNLPIINFNTIRALIQQKTDIQRQFRRQGYVILSPPTTDYSWIIDIAKLFGKIQGHSRSPKDGVVEVYSGPEKTEDHQINSNLSFFAHTDGHYLNGLIRKHNQIFRIGPPKMVILQCVKPSIEGGENFIVDGRSILLNILQNQPHIISTLFSNTATTICRQDHLILDVPVFAKLPSGNLALRFSYDQDLYIPIQSLENIVLFNNNYVLNPAFTSSFSLKEKQILVLDNYRCLHGRTAVKGERLFRRIWVCDEEIVVRMHRPSEAETVAYYTSSKGSQEALERYQDYAPIDDANKGVLKDMPVGINLPLKYKQFLAKLLKAS